MSLVNLKITLFLPLTGEKHLPNISVIMTFLLPNEYTLNLMANHNGPIKTQKVVNTQG